MDEAHGREDAAGEACLVAIRQWAAGAGTAEEAGHEADVAEVEAAVNEEGAGGEEEAEG